MTVHLFPQSLKTRYFVFLFFVLFFGTTSNAQYVRFTRDGEFTYPKSAIDDLFGNSSKASILYGETHTFFFEPMFKCELIVHQNSLYGTRDVFMEIGHGAAFLYNKFLETGDTSYVYNRGIAYVPRRGNYRDTWKKLYDYNRKLPVALKLRIHGVDFERHEVYKVLTMLLPLNAVLPKELNIIFLKVKTHAEDRCQSFEPEFRKIRKELLTKLVMLDSLYKDNFPLVRKILENELGSNFTKARDKTMSKNIAHEIQRFGITQFVGFFGGLHTDYGSPTSIASFLKTTNDFKENLIVINSTYINALSSFTMTRLPYIGLFLDTRILDTYKLGLDRDNDRAVLIKTNQEANGFTGGSDYYLIAYDQ